MKICMINYKNIGLVASTFKIWWINFSKFADVTKLDLVGVPDGCLSIRRSLDRLEKGASRNLQNFNKGTNQVLPLEEIKPGTTRARLKSSFAEKHLVDTMLTMSQGHDLAAAKAAVSSATSLFYPAGPYQFPVQALQDEAGTDIMEQAQ